MFATIFWGAASLIVIAVGALLGGSMLLQRNRIRATAVSTIDALQEGVVAVEGELVPLNPLESPITGTDCVYYEVKVKHMKMTDDGKVKQSSFDLVWDEKTENPFFIKDAHGAVLVDPRGGHIDITPDYNDDNYKIGVGKVTATLPSPELIETFETNNVPYTVGGRPHPMEYQETTLESGTHVYAIGTCSKDPAIIAEALDGLDYDDSLPIDRIIHSPSQKGSEKLYLAPGDASSAGKELLSFGLSVIGAGTAIGAILAYVAYRYYPG